MKNCQVLVEVTAIASEALGIIKALSWDSNLDENLTDNLNEVAKNLDARLRATTERYDEIQLVGDDEDIHVKGGVGPTKQ